MVISGVYSFSWIIWLSAFISGAPKGGPFIAEEKNEDGSVVLYLHNNKDAALFFHYSLTGSAAGE